MRASCYGAALLDSLHDGDHVWAEFELARQLVGPGGAIVTTDWRWSTGVQEARHRVVDVGYAVVRLLGPSAIEEESELGIAVIENRKRM